MASYSTKQGDRLDLICWQYYGRCRDGVVETVLDANPHLADLGPVLPAGVLIDLPTVAAPTKDQDVIRLWD